MIDGSKGMPEGLKAYPKPACVHALGSFQGVVDARVICRVLYIKRQGQESLLLLLADWDRQGNYGAPIE